MYLRKAALRPVPGHAVVDEHAVRSVDDTLDQEEQDLQDWLDRGLRALEHEQPVLSEWLETQIDTAEHALAQSLGFFLAVSIYAIFKEAFPTRLFPVDDAALALALATLDMDAALRADDPREALATDDVVTLGQPAVMAYLQHHIEQALDQLDDADEAHHLEEVYRAVLAEIVALSHAVASPDGSRGPLSESLA